MTRKVVRNNKARRFSFSSILSRDVLTERLEERIVPAYVSGDFGWASTFGTTNVSIEQHVNSSTVDPSGNVYLVGSYTGTVDFDLGTGTANKTAAGGQDAFIQKLDSSGNLVWVKTFSGLLNEKATSVILDASGNLVITGWFQGVVDFDPTSSVNNLTSQGAEDAFITKLTSDGNLIWTKSVGGSGSDQGFTVENDSAANILVGGKFFGTVDFDPASSVNNITSNSGNQDIFILKVSTNGDYVWSKAILGLDNNRKEVFSLTTDANNDVYVGGDFYGSIDLDPDVTTVYSITETGNYNGFFVKLDSNGVFKWGEHIRTTNSAVLTSVVDSTGNVYVGGFFDETVDFDPSVSTHNVSSNGLLDAFVQKLSSNGTLIWVKTWGGVGVEDANEIEIDVNNRLKVSGVFSDTTDFDPGINSSVLYSRGDYDHYISALNLDGSFLGAKSIGEGGRDDRYHMTLNGAGRPVLTGTYAGSMDFDADTPVQSLPVVGGSNFFITQWNRQFTKTTVVASDSLNGANTTITATIQNENNATANGTVTFTDLFNGTTTTLGNGTITNGNATLTLPSMSPGVHKITASYSGDATNFSSVSNLLEIQLDAVSGSWGWAEAIVNRTGNEETNPQIRVTTDADGNIYSVGSFTGTIDFNAGTGTQSFTAASSRDFYLAKLSPSGQLLWFRQWSNNTLFISHIMIDRLNRLNICGFYSGTFDSDPGAGQFNLTSSGNTDGMLIRLSLNGDFIDAMTIGGTGEDTLNSVTYDSGMNKIIAGFFSNTVDFDLTSGVNNKVSAGGKDGYFAKYSPQGELSWVITQSSPVEDYLYDVAINSDDNVYVLGKTYGTVDLDPGISITNNSGGRILAKYSPQGTLLASGPATVGSPYFAPENLVIQNNAVFTSYSQWSGGIWNPKVSRLDLDLNSVWDNRFVSSTNAYTRSLVLDKSNSIYVCATFSGIIDVDPSSSVHNLSSSVTSLFVVKLDSSGNFLNAFGLGGPGIVDSPINPQLGTDYKTKAVGEFHPNIIAVADSGSLILTGVFSGTVDFDINSQTQTLTSIPTDSTKYSRFLLNFSNYAAFSTTTTLTPSTSSSNFGESVTFSAYVTSTVNGAGTPTGTVEFYDGTSLIGTTPLNANSPNANLTTSSLSAGSHVISARYLGDSSFMSSISNAENITILSGNLTISSMLTNASSVKFNFSQAIATGSLQITDTFVSNVLTDQGDLIITDSNNQVVKGSLLISPDATSVKFIKTGSHFADGTYSVRLRSAANAFRNANGTLLDGNGDGIPGGDYFNNFTVSNNLKVLSIPDEVRGPGQALRVNPTDAGIPVKINDANSIYAFEMSVSYDPSMMSFSNITVPASLSGTLQISYNASVAGRIDIVGVAVTGLPAGAQNLFFITGTVPNAALYRSKSELVISNVNLYNLDNSTIPVTIDHGIQLVSYIGDVTGDGRYNALDPLRLQRYLVNLDSWYAQYPLVDPTLIADVTGDGRANVLDSLYLQRYLVNMVVSYISAPPVSSVTQSGLDPIIQLPARINALRGSRIKIPVQLKNTSDESIRLNSFEVAIAIDPRTFKFLGVQSIGRVITKYDGKTGIMVIAGILPEEIEIKSGESVIISDIRLHVRPNASVTDHAINLLSDTSFGRQHFATSVNGGSLILQPAPTDAPNDKVDGSVRIVDNAKFTSLRRRPLHKSIRSARFNSKTQSR